MSKRLHVAIVAPPWLSVPPTGYGGIEEVINNLIYGLRRLPVETTLFTIGASKVKEVRKEFLYADEQYCHIHKPVYESAPIPVAQVMFAFRQIAKAGHFDIIHDHNGFLGPMAAYWANYSRLNLPPVLHTHHGPPFSDKQRLAVGIPDNLPMWRQLADAKGLFLVGVSNSIVSTAPKELGSMILPAVYNSVQLEKFPFRGHKSNHFITLGRFSPDKGQHTAVKLCQELGVELRMSGIVADITSRRKLYLELGNPLSKYRSNGDFSYYSDYIWPATIDNPKIRYLGNLGGQRKLGFLAQAKAMLFPIDWEEPFGMVMIEALACGTPVIAMRRGSVPEIIKHGVNGFIADNEKQFKHYMQRIDEIKPAACRRSVQTKFSSQVMAKNYLDRYRQVIALAKDQY